jgi:hypothetical protein
MSGQPLFARPGATFHLTPTPEARLHVIRMDVTTTPTSDAIEDLSVFFATFCRDFDGRLVFHVRHVETDRLDAPGLPQIVTLVGKLLEAREVVDAKVKGTVVEGNRIDDLVLGAKNLFLSLYQPKRAFDIVDTPRGASDFVDALVARERVKRARRG